MLTLLLASSLASADVATLHAQALSHVRGGDVPSARRLLSRARALDPTSAYCELIEGHCALSADRAAAEALYTRAAEHAQGEEVAEAAHAIARLMRMSERWDEAARAYTRACALRPHSAELAHEAGFASAKAAFLDGRVTEAASHLIQALAVQEGGVWAPHLHRELAHAKGLLGEPGEAHEHYSRAKELGGLPGGFLAMGETLAALAAHHEQSHTAGLTDAHHALELAAAFLRHAADVYAAELREAQAMSGASEALSRRVSELPSESRGEQVPGTLSALASAAADRIGEACFRLGKTLEGLCALGESSTTSLEVAAAVATVSTEQVLQSDADEGALDGLQLALVLFERSAALRPSHAASHERVGRLLLGVSSLANYGARVAGALHTERAEAYLRDAQRLMTGADDSPEGVAQLLAAIEETRRDVEHWREVVAHGLPTVKDTQSGSHGASDALAVCDSVGSRLMSSNHGHDDLNDWDASVWEGATDLPRIEIRSDEEFAEVVRRGEPAILLGLQRDFAPADAWSTSALRGAFGSCPVKVSVSPSGRFDGPEPGELWGLSECPGAQPAEEVLVRPPETHMRLADALSLLEHETPERFYVEYNAMHQVSASSFSFPDSKSHEEGLPCLTP